jgi:hypothetical protein
MSIASPRSTAALAAVTALLFAAPAASAASPATDGLDAAPTADACGYTGTDVFSPWGDNRAYSLFPDGGFENGAAGWVLEDGAAVTEGNESFQVGDAADHQSLSLPDGSSATIPAVCVTKHTGVFRFFVRNDGGRRARLNARLKVEIMYTTGARDKQDVVTADDSWSPTEPLRIGLNRAHEPGSGPTATVTVRFTPVGAPADWQIDDVYIDPKLRQ